MHPLIIVRRPGLPSARRAGPIQKDSCDIFMQEDAPGIAEDQAAIVALGEAIEVPAGDFDDTLSTEDCNPLGVFYLFFPIIRFRLDTEMADFVKACPSNASAAPICAYSGTRSSINII